MSQKIHIIMMFSTGLFGSSAEDKRPNVDLSIDTIKNKIFSNLNLI